VVCLSAIIIKKKWIVLVALAIAVGFSANYFFQSKAIPAFGEPVEELELNMVTGEFKSEVDGKEIEAYRWDPGTVVLPKGENVKLSILGVNGKEHPFIIEGTDIKGVVQKGKETVIDLKFDKEGIYRLICTTHADIEHNGPMIAYLVVD
jgi:heme/copper-type cytochrome/quinol oxidase subunit 2